MQKFKGRVINNSILELIEPKTLNGKDKFKIQDSGNLSHFPVNSVVNFNLVVDKQSGNKLASIISMNDNQEVDTSSLPLSENVNENVLKFVIKEKTNYSKILNPIHFYVVFNPALNYEDVELETGKTQAHSFYNLLKSKISNPEDDKKYLYWGKLKSSESNEKLSHDVFQEILKNNKDKNETTHLYISDFNYLWVAKIENVVFDLDRDQNDNLTLDFYKKNWDKVEVWFKVTDMVLISNNNAETISLISKLVISPENTLNSRKTERVLSVTPYLSGLRYPLAIEDSTSVVHFEKSNTILIENILLEKESTITMATKKNIFSYAIADFVFEALSPIVQREILSAEIIFCNPQNSTSEELFTKDFSVAKLYLIALEKTLKNEIARYGISYGDGSLNDLHRADNSLFRKIEKENNDFYEYIVNLKKQTYLWKFNKIRNDTIHLNDNIIDHQSLINIRRKILGVGSVGILNSIMLSSRPQLQNRFSIKSIDSSFDRKAG